VNNGKTSFREIPPRFVVKENKTDGIINYDTDNSFPQRMSKTVAGSVTATSCLRLYSKFNFGQGFEDDNLMSLNVNIHQTANDVLEATSNDLSTYNGFALHFNYNLLFEITSIKVIPFEYCRFTTEDSKYSGMIAIYDDWAREFSRNIKKDKIKYIDKFTDDKDKIAHQIQRAGGFVNWKGHVLYFSTEGDKYPLPVYDSAINDIETELEISMFKKSNVTTSFLASHFMFLPQEFESDVERSEYMDMLESFQGGRETGKFMLVDGVNDDNRPTIERIDVANNDRLFESTELSVQSSIRRSFLAPKELVGEESASGFETDRIQQARSYYNSITKPVRKKLETIYMKFMPLFTTVVTNNYKLKPLDESSN